MQVTFKWEEETMDIEEEQCLMMKMKGVKDVAVAVIYYTTTGKWMVDFVNETLGNKDHNGFARRETAIRNTERRLGIYKAPKKAKK